jgi:hypothetical protein
MADRGVVVACGHGKDSYMSQKPSFLGAILCVRKGGNVEPSAASPHRHMRGL